MPQTAKNPAFPLGFYASPKGENGRGKRIRTSGPCLPKTVLYQAELFPDRRRFRFLKSDPAGQAAAYRGGFSYWQAASDAFFAVSAIAITGGRQPGS